MVLKSTESSAGTHICCNDRIHATPQIFNDQFYIVTAVNGIIQVARIGPCSKLVRLKLPLPAVHRSLVAPRRILELHQPIGTRAGRVFEIGRRVVPYLNRQGFGVGTPVFGKGGEFYRVGSGSGEGKRRVLNVEYP